MDEVEQAVVGFIANDILHESSTAGLGLDDLLLEDGVLDSLGLQQLVTFLEREFSVKFHDDHLTPENFASIRAIAKLIKQVQGNGPSH